MKRPRNVQLIARVIAADPRQKQIAELVEQHLEREAQRKQFVLLLWTNYLAADLREFRKHALHA